MPREVYDQMLAPGGSLVGGDVPQVIDKLMKLRQLTGATRYVAQIDVGGQSFGEVAKGIELFESKAVLRCDKSGAKISFAIACDYSVNRALRREPSD